MTRILVVLLLALACNAQDGGVCDTPGNLCSIFKPSQVRPFINHDAYQVR